MPDEELKYLNSALIGGIGGVIFLGIALVITASAAGDDPPAGLMLVNMLAGIGLLAFWISGLTNAIRVLVFSPVYRGNPKAIAGYALVSIPPIYIVIASSLES